MKLRRISPDTLLITAALLLLAPLPSLRAASLPLVTGVEWQPLAAQVERVLQAATFIGEPFSPAERERIDAAIKEKDAAKLQAALDTRCLLGVHINPEMRVKVQQGPAKPELLEQGWRTFLVKVHNEAGTTAALQAVSPNALTVWERDGRRDNSPSGTLYRDKDHPADTEHLWLDLSTFDKSPLRETLGGLALEYRILQLFSRDAGKREAKLSFHAGQGTQDLGFRNEVDVLFDCVPARLITFRVKDEDGRPAIAAFEIRDSAGRVYPLPSKRLEPDFFFQPQVYRSDGETVRLPAGSYSIVMSRGPESVAKKSTLTVTAQTQEAEFKIERWIDPSKRGWWSGDHHIHAAGCAHYVKPTEGVLPAAMIRHVKGEDLKIGANLTWGPGFDYQKQFFCGTVDKVSEYPYLLRYDIEVSQFGSHQSGHLVLLRLKEQIYPGGDSKNHWPTLGLNTLRWAKKQGAVCGPAHSGSGLDVKSTELPNYLIPPYNGIGANEYVVDITHEVAGPDGQPVPALDFTSTVDTNFRSELNMWYHGLNCGFRQRISGETDFPCISGERVGMGRSYVKLDGKLDYDQWCEGIRQGRCYVSEGKSHLLDFKVNDVAVGEKGSELRLAKPGSVRATVQVAALLDEHPTAPGRFSWNIEKARIEGTREVPVELIVNGQPVARQTVVADGKVRDVSFEARIERSSWVAVRILPSSHSNPVFVLVDGKPIRASRRSAEWCLKGVDQCWSQKERT
ncbi:MAG TPA: CehA/McbA family metallohydrolase, partial [Candidatus Saccharimonadales bacterium]|nr:CehA/McbA family metallohydrolase [Candidatus Saccharimonadales bacterium]